MLLHIGDTAQNWTTVDPRVAAAGLAAFLAAAAAIWRPLRSLRVPRPQLRRVATVLAALVVFAAILPSVLPYDHLVPPAHAAGHDDVHAAHCHISPGSCSDAPVSAGAGQFLSSEPLIVVPVLFAVLIVVTAPVLAGASPRPDLRPPLLAA